MRDMPEPEFIRDQIIPRFPFEGDFEECAPYGNGHINDTFCPWFRLPDGTRKRYILQRINTEIFRDPDALMENVVGVTGFLRRQIIQAGGDPDRETLTVIPTRDGSSYYRDIRGGCWRVYLFVERTISYDLAESAEDFYKSARAFGQFQTRLAEYPAASLHETIPKFHDTVNRFENLKRAIEADALGRVSEVGPEIEFVMAREKDTHVLLDLQQAGEIPLRVTHNDTKLNNILIDETTKQGICVIDLDTVMPGLAHYDFGDSIRFGASTALEDERDLSLVSMDLGLFEAFTKGFLETAGEVLTPLEKETLSWGAKLMTLECGMRFLTDYLEGDHYFKVHRPGHNLDRTRTQFKLVEDMEKKWDAMAEIVKKYS